MLAAPDWDVKNVAGVTFKFATYYFKFFDMNLIGAQTGAWAEDTHNARCAGPSSGGVEGSTP